MLTLPPPTRFALRSNGASPVFTLGPANSEANVRFVAWACGADLAVKLADWIGSDCILLASGRVAASLPLVSSSKDTAAAPDAGFLDSRSCGSRGRSGEAVALCDPRFRRPKN